MTSITTKPDSSQPATEMAVDLFDNWFDPIETEVRARAREFIEELIRGELDAVLARPRYGRSQMASSEERAGVARRILGAHAAYYNESRIHRSLNKDAPFHRAIERLGAITSHPILGGRHHHKCKI